MAAFVIAFAGLPGIFVYNNGLFGLKDKGVSVAQAKAVTNGYILEIATGLNDGSDIEFIEFSYEAEDGNTYKRFLFPGEDSLANGYKLAAQVASDVSIAREVSSDYDYGMQHEWDEVGPGTGLKQNAVVQYYFITESPIKNITKFDAFIGKKGKWTCLRMQLYKVDDLAGLRMAGTYSNTWYIDYTGTLIAELTNPISSTWSDDNANYLHMTQKADLKTDFSDVSYATHELQSDYGIRIDFADVYGAGLEYLTYPYGESVHALKSFDYAEGFALTLTYKDTYGIDRFLNLPVITNTVLYLAKSRVKDSKVVGIAQQGDTIYFEGSIPDLVKLESVSITLGTNKTYDLLGIKTVKNKSAITSREGLSNKDDISINCMAIYDKKTTTVTPYTEGALLKYVFEGDPVYSHVATISSGEGFYSNETNSLSLGTYNKKGLVPVDNNDYYLVEFKTDDIASAGTNGDLFMQLTYANVSGYEAKTAEISLRDATRDLYGYWPALMEDYAYQRGTTPGNIMQAILQLNDVDRFTGLTIRMGDTNADDYQFKDIKIY
ncbi:MAG: hypothetical protein J6Z02_09430, partial [Lachnospiraceae bacterium]|nr:hypothetical protein [Lachnospiraceae bacterium]